MRRWAVLPLAFLVLALGVALLSASPTTAQESPQDEANAGRISGVVVSGTAGVEPADVEVRLVVLEGGEVVRDDIERTGGAFEFAAEVGPERTYVLTARSQGVQYFDPAGPIVLTADRPDVARELTVYEATTEVPELRITETIVALVGIDRARGELWLRREDYLVVPGDRVFVGDETGVTLRLPAPLDTIEVSGGALQDVVVAIDSPLFPGEQSIVTQYLVRYDPAEDDYPLRVIAPALTDRMELRVPDGYVHRLEPLEGAEHGEDVEAPDMDGPELEDVVMRTVILDAPSEPGRGLLVDLVGLSGTRTSHPLTEQPGASIAAGVALALITGTAVVGLRRRGTRS